MSEEVYQRPPVKVALVGLGRSMFFDHYPIYKAHPALFDVVCACDTEKDRRGRVAADYPKCKMFRQLADMLDEPEIDLVDIATPSGDHVEHALASLKKGFWTLLETPIALTQDEVSILKGAAVKAKNRLIILQRGMFDAGFLLTKQMMTDPRLGQLQHLEVRKNDYIRRDDWQCIKRLGGGASYYAMPDIMMQTLKLMPLPPSQMWSDLKRIASLGDAEDYCRVSFKTREVFTVDVEYNGGNLDAVERPAFALYGEQGVFKVNQGANEGILTAIDPAYKIPRRRSSVRTPEIADMHENLPIIKETIRLPEGTHFGPAAFWKHVYEAVRIAMPFPYTLDDSIEAMKFSFLMKKTSPFGR